MLLFFERGIRGGITQAVHRYAAANNKYMGNKYNPKNESVYLPHLDANNLYGGTMCVYLPTGGFKWKSNVEDFTRERIAKLAKKKNKGYTLEVDVDYPKELHEKHNDLPFLPEKLTLHKVEKLVPNLNNKRKYIVHIKALNQALNHGLVLKKVHRVIEYNQSAWLRGYINHNTILRMNSTSEFAKDFFKLMNNSVFGKTMENIRMHKDMKLVTSEKKYNKQVMKPNFKDGRRFSDHLMAAEMGKTKIKMTKPVYLGHVILDLSKTIMYEFHYDYMLPKYGKKIKLCYMDTDSFVYRIETHDFYRDIADDVENRFDTSGYPDVPKDHVDFRPLPVGKNKKVLNMMKDELGGKIMTEFIGLRAKSYSYKILDEEREEKKCKGS